MYGFTKTPIVCNDKSNNQIEGHDSSSGRHVAHTGTQENRALGLNAVPPSSPFGASTQPKAVGHYCGSALSIEML